MLRCKLAVFTTSKLDYPPRCDFPMQDLASSSYSYTNENGERIVGVSIDGWCLHLSIFLDVKQLSLRATCLLLSGGPCYGY
ncbi:hypothetical protein Hypma_007064 [Hypsizygus marmoreus]|uniref:Uncharacterized protein n=1 Tax=Hypsizygus marmoreus TaxID=39966 RepID=A0A369KAN6_HYPMA|nr:hypothetical protein Hypma_007064 [Hypsizygus marmoreus]